MTLNNMGQALSSLQVSYNVWGFNDDNRSTSMNFSYSTDNVSYTSVPGIDFTTPVAADVAPD